MSRRTEPGTSHKQVERRNPRADKHLSAQQLARLTRLYVDHPEISVSTIAARFGIGPDTVTSLIPFDKRRVRGTRR
ncbi:hypothetical protein IZ6_07360 [Terrihabitans soli]|uniref:Helix-turn-helix domain-containing protein n=1 Tax=Terrihabitans soli TaxID=708113 RepID=A0A6S6QSG7_9HYPH|nr:hypothetical protein [Terrihabitans soli]BCJ90001.1 hypothetical protein IZ6_07360 [Terrihabitans soli]